MDPTLEEKLDDIIGKWESDDPGSTDIDAPPAAPEAPAEMTLPEVDLSSEPARLPPRGPTKSIKSQPATMGAGPGVLPRGGIGIRPDPSAKPMASPDSLDWKQLGDRLAKAHVTDDISRSAENYLSNAANSGQYHARAETGTNEALAKMPLQLAKERQGLERGQLANDAAKSKIGVAAAESDPSSLQSQKAREAFKTFLGDTVRTPAGFENWSAADLKHFASTGDMARIMATKNAASDDAVRAEKQAFERTRHEQERKEDLENRRMNHEDNQANAKVMQALAKGASDRAENPKLPPGQVAEVADYKSAAKAADQLFADFESSDLGGIMSKVEGKASDATGADLGAVSRYNDKANTAAQTIGLALEGGKLGEADLPRYKAMMPQPGDSIERAQAKRDNLKRALADKAAGRSTEWLRAGYKVPGADTPSIPETRPMKNGGTAYRGAKSGKWFTTPAEAQAN